METLIASITNHLQVKLYFHAAVFVVQCQGAFLSTSARLLFSWAELCCSGQGAAGKAASVMMCRDAIILPMLVRRSHASAWPKPQHGPLSRGQTEQQKHTGLLADAQNDYGKSNANQTSWLALECRFEWFVGFVICKSGRPHSSSIVTA